MAKNNTKRSLQMAVVLVLAISLIYWQYTALSPTELAEIKAALEATRWSYLFYAILIGLASHLVRALRWRLLLSRVGHQVSARNTTLAVLSGYLANTLVPRLGEVIRCSSLTRTDAVPFEKSLGTVISERIFDALCLLLIFVLIFALEYHLLADYGFELVQQFLYEDGALKAGKIILLIGLALLGIILVLVVIRNVKNPKLKALVSNMLQGLKSILTLKQKTLFLAYTVAMWFLYVAMVFVALKAVPQTEHLGWMPALAVTAVGSIAIIFTPGGIGAYPPIAAGILALYGIEYSSGLATGWVSWLMQTITVLVLGILAAAFISWLSPHKKTSL